MQPIPHIAPVPSLDPSIVQLRKDPTPDRPVGSSDPDARMPALTEASCESPAGVGHDGWGSWAGGGDSVGVGLGQPDLPRNGDPPGPQPLARCCGARTRSGPGCRGLAMANGRCRMHGGASTGPRTPEGFAKLIAARTRHGRHCAAQRALRRHHRIFVERIRLLAEAEALWPYLSPDLRARLDRGPAELGSLVHPSRVPGPAMAGEVEGEAGLRLVVPVVGRDARGRFSGGPRVAGPGRVLRGRAAERAGAQAEAVALAPWKAGIAQALMARGMVLAGRRAVREAEVRNDPIGGRATGGGGAANGAGAQRPYRRPEGGDGGAAARAAARVVPDPEVRNDPIGGSATGGGGAANGAGAQRPYRRLEGAGGGAGDDAAVRAGNGAARVVETRNDPVAGNATREKFGIGAGASRPQARPDGADVAVWAARGVAGIADTRNHPVPGNATGDKFAIGVAASRPHAWRDGARGDLVGRAGPGVAGDGGVAAGAGIGVLRTAAAGWLGRGWGTAAVAGNEASQREAVWPVSGGLRAGLLGSSSLDGWPTAVRVRGGMPALIAAVAAGGDVQAAFDALCM